MNFTPEMKVRFTDCIASSADYLQPLHVVVEVLNKCDIELSAEQFLAWLVYKGYVDSENEPTEHAFEKKYIALQELTAETQHGMKISRFQYMFTGIGMYHFFECLYNEKGANQQ